MGSARVLPPEALDRKIIATTGIQWMRGESPALLDPDNYKFFFGGIDSINVTTRLTELNAVMNNIADRMANEIACQATAARHGPGRPVSVFSSRTWSRATPAKPRFARTSRTSTNTYWERRLPEGDPELERTYQVFLAVLEDGTEKMESGEYGPGTCRTVSSQRHHRRRDLHHTSLAGGHDLPAQRLPVPVRVRGRGEGQWIAETF